MDTLARDAGLWVSARRFWIRRAGDDEGDFHEVERCRAYRNRLVLKLAGVDGAAEAVRFRRAEVYAAPRDAAALPEGTYHADRLLGLEVVDESGRRLGWVDGVLATGGTDVLRVLPPDPQAGELLVPLARAIVRDIDEPGRRITVRLPPGLEGLNRE